MYLHNILIIKKKYYSDLIKRNVSQPHNLIINILTFYIESIPIFQYKVDQFRT